MKVLRIKIYQPEAHYRIPFTYQRRHTYPIPPYSTVKSLLCNLLGIRRGIDLDNDTGQDIIELRKLKEARVAISGTFESRTSEYTWFRNLSKSSHIDRFGYVENRRISSHIEHPGGQMPVTVDILNDVRVVIHLHHNDESFLNKIERKFKNPKGRLGTLHLGRSEDWIVVEEIEFAELELKEIEGVYRHFFWIPENIYRTSRCVFDFKKIGGLLYKMPTFYTIVEGVRSFNYVNVKLNDGNLSDIKMFFDNRDLLPVFFFD